MENHLKYKNYKGSIHYSSADGVWYGKILEINDLVSYEAELKENLKKVFVEAVEDYLRNK
ncbi:DNA repair protein [Leeuwenhoekiella polynyae]|uniref:DNA repair protein n=1 Tax=Leeuwenhoekiella polynyae TaxID=1550906 RepID=UPI000FFF10DB|nr:DNA repair protein [Leeuwenhoekiella polynyae]